MCGGVRIPNVECGKVESYRWEIDLVELTSDVFFTVLLLWVFKLQGINGHNLSVASFPLIAVKELCQLHFDLKKILPSNSFKVVL